MENPFEVRIKRFESELKKSKIQAALVFQLPDLYYFTGLVFQGALLVIPDKGYVVGVLKPWERAKEDLRVLNKRKLNSWRELPLLFDSIGVEIPSVVGMELDVIPYGWVKRFLKYLGVNGVEDVSGIIRSLRATKDFTEISALKASGQILRKTFEWIPSFVKIGMKESEIAIEIEKYMRSLGHEPVLRVRRFNLELYYGAMGTGRSTAAPTLFDGPVGTLGFSPAVPYFVGDDVLREGDTFLVDLMANKGGYITDATRTYFLGKGNIPEKVLKAHGVALNILEKTREFLKPGNIPEELYFQGVRLVEAVGLQDYYMGFKENQVKFLGHGVGLEVDELPVLAPRFKTPLEEGMIIAVEPKFFFGDYSCGIEETFVVTKEGGVPLIGGELDIIKI